jgi:hypothetical protein
VVCLGWTMTGVIGACFIEAAWGFKWLGVDGRPRGRVGGG